MYTTEQCSTSQYSEAEMQSAAEELAEIVMHMQRKFLRNLSEKLGRGSVSFPQYFLLGCLDRQEVITMSGAASKMGHTTAAATGLVDRLEKLGYVERSPRAGRPPQSYG
jgi:DNA-binding MarR family transcriptional regulator